MLFAFRYSHDSSDPQAGPIGPYEISTYPYVDHVIYYVYFEIGHSVNHQWRDNL